MMKFTLAWLKEHLDTDAPLAAIVDKLTMIGLEVESVADRGKMLAPFTIARVISAERHPNADRLRVCMVDTGTGDPVQVVCGAPNARAGMKGVFVPPGAFIPGKNMTLGVGKIRGVESRGMLVSEFELQISDDHEGIIELPDAAPVGANYAQWAGLDDPVIEINLTPNRADCAGVNGIARDLAAAGMGRLKGESPQWQSKDKENKKAQKKPQSKRKTRKSTKKNRRVREANRPQKESQRRRRRRGGSRAR
jgi:phenylalanyl-tRNA synthetase beta chain